MAAIVANADQVTEQLRASFGNLTHAAGRLNTSRETLYKFIDKHPSVAAALRDIREATLDRAESMLQQRMSTSDTLLIFFLKTQGYKRGYGDRSQVDVKITDVSKLSDDELNAILKD
jgi:hypothetical protein